MRRPQQGFQGGEVRHAPQDSGQRRRTLDPTRSGAQGKVQAEEAFASAANGYRRLSETLHEIERRLKDAPAGSDTALDSKIAARVTEFEDAMRDDFNTPKAVAALFGLTGELNTALNAGPVGRDTLERAQDAYRSLGGDVLGLFAETGSAASVAQDDAPVIDALMDLVLKARQNYRLQKQYAEADELRDTLGKAGITVEDTKDGARWKR